MNKTETITFEGWAIIEQLGHKRIAGYVTDVVLAGAGFLRVDIPGGDGKMVATQFISPQTVYAITPTTEEVARRTAALDQPRPVTAWELRQAALPSRTVDLYPEDEDMNEVEVP